MSEDDNQRLVNSFVETFHIAAGEAQLSRRQILMTLKKIWIARGQPVGSSNSQISANVHRNGQLLEALLNRRTVPIDFATCQLLSDLTELVGHAPQHTDLASISAHLRTRLQVQHAGEMDPGTSASRQHDVPAALIEWRKARGLTQQQAAMALEVSSHSVIAAERRGSVTRELRAALTARSIIDAPPATPEAAPPAPDIDPIEAAPVANPEAIAQLAMMIRQQRQARNLTTRALSDRLKINLSALNHVESGEASPRFLRFSTYSALFTTYDRLADWLGTDPELGRRYRTLLAAAQPTLARSAVSLTLDKIRQPARQLAKDRRAAGVDIGSHSRLPPGESYQDIPQARATLTAHASVPWRPPLEHALAGEEARLDDCVRAWIAEQRRRTNTPPPPSGDVERNTELALALFKARTHAQLSQLDAGTALGKRIGVASGTARDRIATIETGGGTGLFDFRPVAQVLLHIYAPPVPLATTIRALIDPAETAETAETPRIPGIDTTHSPSRSSGIDRQRAVTMNALRALADRPTLVDKIDGTVRLIVSNAIPGGTYFPRRHEVMQALRLDWSEYAAYISALRTAELLVSAGPKGHKYTRLFVAEDAAMRASAVDLAALLADISGQLSKKLRTATDAALAAVRAAAATDGYSLAIAFAQAIDSGDIPADVFLPAAKALQRATGLPHRPITLAYRFLDKAGYARVVTGGHGAQVNRQSNAQLGAIREAALAIGRDHEQAAAILDMLPTFRTPRAIAYAIHRYVAAQKIPVGACFPSLPSLVSTLKLPRRYAALLLRALEDAQLLVRTGPQRIIGEPPPGDQVAAVFDHLEQQTMIARTRASVVISPRATIHPAEHPPRPIRPASATELIHAAVIRALCELPDPTERAQAAAGLILAHILLAGHRFTRRRRLRELTGIEFARISELFRELCTAGVLQPTRTARRHIIVAPRSDSALAQAWSTATAQRAAELRHQNGMQQTILETYTTDAYTLAEIVRRLALAVLDGALPPGTALAPGDLCAGADLDEECEKHVHAWLLAAGLIRIDACTAGYVTARHPVMSKQAVLDRLANDCAAPFETSGYVPRDPLWHVPRRPRKHTAALAELAAKITDARTIDRKMTLLAELVAAGILAPGTRLGRYAITRHLRLHGQAAEGAQRCLTDAGLITIDQPPHGEAMISLTVPTDPVAAIRARLPGLLATPAPREHRPGKNALRRLQQETAAGLLRGLAAGMPTLTAKAEAIAHATVTGHVPPGLPLPAQDDLVGILQLTDVAAGRELLTWLRAIGLVRRRNQQYGHEVVGQPPSITPDEWRATAAWKPLVDRELRPAREQRSAAAVALLRERTAGLPTLAAKARAIAEAIRSGEVPPATPLPATEIRAALPDVGTAGADNVIRWLSDLGLLLQRNGRRHRVPDQVPATPIDDAASAAWQRLIGRGLVARTELSEHERAEWQWLGALARVVLGIPAGMDVMEADISWLFDDAPSRRSWHARRVIALSNGTGYHAYGTTVTLICDALLASRNQPQWTDRTCPWPIVRPGRDPVSRFGAIMAAHAIRRGWTPSDLAAAWYQHRPEDCVRVTPETFRRLATGDDEASLRPLVADFFARYEAEPEQFAVDRRRGAHVLRRALLVAKLDELNLPAGHIQLVLTLWDEHQRLDITDAALAAVAGVPADLATRLYFGQGVDNYPDLFGAHHLVDTLLADETADAARRFLDEQLRIVDARERAERVAYGAEFPGWAETAWPDLGVLLYRTRCERSRTVTELAHELGVDSAVIWRCEAGVGYSPSEIAVTRQLLARLSPDHAPDNSARTLLEPDRPYAAYRAYLETAAPTAPRAWQLLIVAIFDQRHSAYWTVDDAADEWRCEPEFLAALEAGHRPAGDDLATLRRLVERLPLRPAQRAIAAAALTWAEGPDRPHRPAGWSTANKPPTRPETPAGVPDWPAAPGAGRPSTRSR